MSDNYEAIALDDWDAFSKNELFPNIMLLGKTGCGKSSLINLIFGKDLAYVDDVARGTTEFKTFYGKDYGLGVNLIDSRGYETEDGAAESFDKYFEAIKRKIKESAAKNPLEKIHIVWYCISVAGKRIQPYDIEVLKLLKESPELKDRVAIVLTKCDKDSMDRNITKTFKQIIDADLSTVIPVFEVSANPKLPLQLDELIDWSANRLDDEDLKDAFISSQILNLNAKRGAVAKRIMFYTAAAAGIGATPIPISDIFLLTPLQIAMATNIIYIYGMQNIASISSAVVGNVLVANLGKAVAGGLLKLIPGVGQIVGGIINAGVASGITAAFGHAVSEICYDCCKGTAKGEQIDFSNIFNTETIKEYVQNFMEKSKNRAKNAYENLVSKSAVQNFIDEYLRKYKKN